MNTIRLFCLVKGEGTMHAFAIKINKNETISDLKKKIRLDQPRAFSKTDSKDLRLWMVNVRDDGQDEIRCNVELRPTREIEEYWAGTPSKNHIHVVVERLTRR
ncbi:hypothetical protein RclHR1_03360016 [Rhizophagus clarus]|uniref:Crinkler effector protein N-terminal domain-containing protein n=1 Tax=Rhizophagus clarus TaxID=94130 RepID=A0A2Z6RP63_9GLOM|nr:hypothetical protein RclHR1_03360016 [Rhizophagus clarus]GES95799.1 hypothetical protein GLOIN_2v1691277 [Rhizophagus clarus]